MPIPACPLRRLPDELGFGGQRQPAELPGQAVWSDRGRVSLLIGPDGIQAMLLRAFSYAMIGVLVGGLAMTVAGTTGALLGL